MERSGALLEEAASGNQARGRAGWVRRLLALTRPRAVLVLTLAIFNVPALSHLLGDVQRAPYRWLASDTFYYLTVGRNVARHGVVAFDGTHPSNGYHPAWQAYVALVELLRERLHMGMSGPLLLVLSGLGAITGALWLLGQALHEERRLTWWFVGAPVGVYAILVLPIWAVGLRLLQARGFLSWLLPVFGSLWSYANGMESALVILCFAAALRLGAMPTTLSSRGRALAFGACLAGLTLARLDHGGIALLLWLGFGAVAQRARATRRWLEAAVTFALPVTIYLVLNHRYFGSFVPLSGVAKSTFPHLRSDNWDVVIGLLHGKPSHTLGDGDSVWWLPVVWRELQTILPALLGLFYLALRLWRGESSPLQALLMASALGALILAGYNFGFTGMGDQGFWYYPVSTLLPTLFVLSEGWPVPALRRWPRLRALGIATLSAGVLVFFLRWHLHEHYNDELLNVATQSAPYARAHFHGQPPRILEIDDGVVGYSLDTPALSSALALDPEGFKALKSGKLLDLAMARGLDRIASAIYQPSDTSPSGLAGWVGASLGADVSAYTFEKELQTPDGQLLIVRVRRR